MLKSEIEIGGRYIANVSNKPTTVEVLAITKRAHYRGNSSTRYIVKNLKTGRITEFRSAAKFRVGVKSD